MGKVNMQMKFLLEYIERGDCSFVADLNVSGRTVVELYSINVL
jgi:hypothetical protein